MKYFLPANLDIDKLLQDRPPTNIKSFKRECLFYIIHLINWIPAINKGLETRNGYVPINSTVLQRKVRNYRAYFDYLLANKIIESDNQYIKGKKSKGYRLVWKYCQAVKVVDGSDNALQSERSENKLSVSIKRKYNHLLKWYNSDLQIDYGLAMKYAKEELHRKLSLPALQSLRARHSDKNPWQQYNCTVINIEKFASAAFSVSIDSNVCRLHSVLSNMYSPIRNCLSFNGLELVSIDINNSQPYLSTILLNPLFWLEDCNEVLSVMDVYPLYKKDIFSSSCSFLSSFIMLCNDVKTHNSSDLKLYIELVKEGKFYEYIKKEMLLGINDKKVLKASVFQVLFTDNRYIGQNDAEPKRLFKKHFPTVYKIFSQIKKHDKANLPRLLQRIESYLVLQVITKRIARAKSELPIFTIHDSIITTKGNEGYVQTVMAEELEKAIGFAPKSSIEYWNSENLVLSGSQTQIAA
jgi:hypothetical protein